MPYFRLWHRPHRRVGRAEVELKKSPEKFVSVEEATDKRPLWKQFLLG